MSGFELPRYPFRRPPEVDGHDAPVHDVVVVGAGLTGLLTAVALAQYGPPVVLVDDQDTVATLGQSSRGVVWAQRTLEIFDNVGIGSRVLERGVRWTRGRVFDGEREIYAFEFPERSDEKLPSFLNLQQFYIEQFLVDRIAELPNVDLRWLNTVEDVAQRDDHVILTVATPKGRYALRAKWVVACDGAHSTIAKRLGVAYAAKRFGDTWCIADFELRGQRLDERRFWIRAPLPGGGAAILHPMGDGVARFDRQIGHLEDLEVETTPGRIRERVAQLLGSEADFDLVWSGAWRYSTRLAERFVHGRCVLAGDAAHVVPPFGARGGNGGAQDADNLAWKLAMVLRGHACPELIDTYEIERREAALENAERATGSAAFIAAETPGTRLFRDALLRLAPHHARIRPMVNTGRLSSPCSYRATPLSVPDEGRFDAGPPPGGVALDGVLRTTEGRKVFLRDVVAGRFAAFLFTDGAGEALGGDEDARTVDLGIPVDVVTIVPSAVAGERTDRCRRLLIDQDGRLCRRYDAVGGATYVLRPDGYVLGRSREASTAAVSRLLARAMGPLVDRTHAQDAVTS